ncbi:MAG: hypothetical protein HY825_20090 [Acidobacteria bacterium]|nr:hypothetical protein [Acidobacteriota bacterium]
MDALHVQVPGGTVVAVPSVHNSLPHAERVNALARGGTFGAVAVELPPPLVPEVVRWLRDLGIHEGSPLPCMLGLLSKPGTGVRALPGGAGNIKEKPASSCSALYLSPTDSIVEAIRSAVELGLPVFGVDAAHAGWRKPDAKSLMLPDPHLWATMEGYAGTYAAAAAGQRDPVVDAPREAAMVAGLLNCVHQHGDTLFVCGLAHWLPVLEGLGAGAGRERSEIRNAPISTSRVIVHPAEAAGYLDSFPLVAAEWASVRVPAGRGGAAVSVDVRALFLRLLRKFYSEYFTKVDSGLDARSQDLSALPGFEALIAAECTLRQRRAPDLALVSSAVAGQVVSRPMARALTEELMRLDWASPKSRHPAVRGLPVMEPCDGAESGYYRLVGKNGREIGPRFHIGRHGREGVPGLNWDWEDAPRKSELRSAGYYSNWLPIDVVCMALALKSADVALAAKPKRRSEPFSGSMRDGLDIRATIRSHSRGEDRIYIRDRAGSATSKSPKPAERSVDEGILPYVWIFTASDPPGAEWSVFSDAIENLRPWFQYSITAGTLLKAGSSAVMGLSYEEKSIDRRLSRHGHCCTRGRVFGSVQFYPNMFTVRQAARWVESRGRCPACSPWIDGVKRHYRDCHDIALENEPWDVTLLLMGLPFARRSMNVIVPDHYQVPARVRREAAARGVELRVLPHSAFPREWLQTASTHVMLETLARDPVTDAPIYPEHAEAVLGEPKTANRHLVPEWWLNYGEE